MLKVAPYRPQFKQNMTSKITLINFFIFNSTLGLREGEEHKRILLYYPQTSNLDKKIRDIGLSEALVKFASTFTDKDVQSMHTQKTRQLFYQPEPEFWLVMTVSLPVSTRMEGESVVTEHHEDNVQDQVYEAVLRQAYEMFKLFNGSISTIIKKHSLDGLKQILEHFFYKYLPGLKFDSADILDVFNGIHFLPLDKNTYLQVQSFISNLESTYSLVKYTAFLYNDQLVWNGLDYLCMRTLYQYLTLTLFPSLTSQDQQSGVLDLTSSEGRYLLGPPDLTVRSLGKIPFVHMWEGGEVKRYCLVVYRALSASLCMLLDGAAPPKFDVLVDIANGIGQSLRDLASQMREQPAPDSLAVVSSDPIVKYIYFNCMNLAQKTTVHTHGKRGSASSIPKDVLKLTADLHADLKLATNVDEGETLIKTGADFWVVGKKSDQREFYVILNQKNATLTQINVDFFEEKLQIPYQIARGTTVDQYRLHLSE